MRALKNRLVLKADTEQKSTIKFGSLTLFMPPNQTELNQDGKVANPVLAEVVGNDPNYPHIEKGDFLVLNHNMIGNKAFQAMEKEGSVITMVIPIDKGILGKLGSDGSIIPLCENILAERIFEKPASSIIVTPDAYRKTEQNKVKILAVSPEAHYLQSGKTAIVHKYSDYECSYTINGESRTAIIVWMVDVVGTM
jgi:co-chaperonin GroES (HSP10)